MARLAADKPVVRCAPQFAADKHDLAMVHGDSAGYKAPLCAQFLTGRSSIAVRKFASLARLQQVGVAGDLCTSREKRQP